MKTIQIMMNEWQQKRQKGIGGSDCSAIIGKNPYMSNVDLWKIKTGRLQKEDISNKECVIYGNKLEPVLIDLFEADNQDYEVIDKEQAKQDKFHNFIYDKEYNFLFANLDGIIKNKENGKLGVLEIKTCTINQYNKNKWTNTIPINYYCQVLHYLMVTQYSFAFVYALLKHQNYIEIKKYNILKNEVQEEIDYIRQKEIEFWTKYVEKDIEPNLLINI